MHTVLTNEGVVAVNDPRHGHLDTARAQIKVLGEDHFMASSVSISDCAQHTEPAYGV